MTDDLNQSTETDAQNSADEFGQPKAMTQTSQSDPVATNKAKIAKLAYDLMRARFSKDKPKQNLFIIGAGMSVTANIPDAAKIAQFLSYRVFIDTEYSFENINKGLDETQKDELKNISELKELNNKNELDWHKVYDYLFKEKINDPSDVQDLFSEIIDNAKGAINWAHLCLGHLANKGHANTIITTNFDQLVLKGLIMSGVVPVISDGVESLNRIKPSSRHTQLIEIHGSRHCYQLINRPEQTKDIKGNPGANFAIGGLFKEAKTIVVIGYGGREEGFMDILIEAAKFTDNKKIYWVTYGNEASLSPKANEFLDTSINKVIIENQDADAFFSNLIQEMKIGAPDFIDNPLISLKDNLKLIKKSTLENKVIAEQINSYEITLDKLNDSLARINKKTEAILKNTITKKQISDLILKGENVEALNLIEDSEEKAQFVDFALQAISSLKTDHIESELLEKEITYLKLKLKQSDREEDPLGFAMTQNNLGFALFRLGEREAGTARLNEAVAVFRLALEERTRKSVPLQWAHTQNNLGLVLRKLGQREASTKRLNEAVEACKLALEELTRERVPLDWAATQNNLGNALQVLGERETDQVKALERLNEAVEACKLALKERTRERVPLDWAMTQNNLGNALSILGEREADPVKALGCHNDAVAAYRFALLEYTREREPLYWAMTQMNLGIALRNLGEREAGTVRLNEAVEAYRQALLEWTRERVPLDWAMTQYNLSFVYRDYYHKTQDRTHIQTALTHADAALEVYEQAKASYDITRCQIQIAKLKVL